MTTLARSRYLDHYAKFRPVAGTDAYLNDLRERGMARFSAVGFPTTRDEEWKYTNVSSMVQLPFELPPAQTPAPAASDLEPFSFGATSATLVFVNGRFSAELSKLDHGVEGLTVLRLADALAQKEQRERLQRHLARHADIQACPFTALNQAFFEDGLYVHVKRNAQVDLPVHVLYVATDTGTPTMTHPRNLILVAPRGKVAVVESYVALTEEVSFSNAVTEVVVSEEAHVEHYLVERENRQSFNVQTLASHQCRASDFSSHSVLLGGAIVRNNVNPVLDGEGGTCLINGLYIGGGTQHLDNHMRVVHAKPHCDSRQFYKGILNDQGRGVFAGRIIVRPGAQKTDAKQTNTNLLLSKDAQADTRPQLEIYADDVKCTHGATVGQINEEAIFYLQSRGIDREAARSLLVFAYANESLDRMQNQAVRKHLQGLLTARLPHGELVEGAY